MKVGFIGLGHMGGPMCRNIIKGGFATTVFDLREDAVADCVEAGGTAASSLREVAAEADVIFTSLPKPQDMEAVTLGPDGIRDAARPGAIYVDLTTNSPLMVRKVANEMTAADIKMLDAPVSGGVAGAVKGTLAIMAGGDKGVFDACMPVFDAFGENIVHVGDIGTGCIAKLVNNMIAFCNMAAAAEGLMLGVAAGIDPAVLNNVIRTSSGNSLVYRATARNALSGDWSANFALDLAYKDMHLALELADELAVPVALAAPTHNLMRMAQAMGYGGDDATSMLRVYETVMGRRVNGETE